MADAHAERREMKTERWGSNGSGGQQRPQGSDDNQNDIWKKQEGAGEEGGRNW